MTPQERQLVDDLFDRLSRAETAPRDAEAERAIADGLERAPHAIYALVQTALVQDEALKRADARIRALNGDAAPATGGGFLESMRNALGGRGATSVPSVNAAPATGPDPRWNNGGTAPSGFAPAAPYTAPSPGGGGSFLGSTATSVAGMIGGALLFNSIGSLFGQHSSPSAFGDTRPEPAPSPWDHGTGAANSDLARDAGLNDIGAGSGFDGSRHAGLFDTDGNDADQSDAGDFDGGDFGGDSA